MCKRNKLALRLTAMAALAIASASPASGATLAFNRVLLVGTSAQTVPAGTVWKVESLQGSGDTPTCMQTQQGAAYRFFSAFGFEINGSKRYVQLNPIPSDLNYYSNSNCTTAWAPQSCALCCDGSRTLWCAAGSCNATSTVCSPANVPVIYDKVAFPFWLPAGTSLRALGGPDSALSVLEFNVVP